MRVRVGYGAGTQGLARDGDRFGELVDGLEQVGFDSLWVSERATGPIPDPPYLGSAKAVSTLPEGTSKY